jgi:hypothetical protein
MQFVEGPAVESDIGRVIIRLEEVLATVVAGLAQALQFGEEELGGIALVWLDMVCDRRRDDPTLTEAEGAQGMLSQLASTQPLPAGGLDLYK